MPREVTPKSTLESLKREAKRWLKALRANVREARARFEQAFPDAPAMPGLRDVQHALAREHGLIGWAALKDALTSGAFVADPQVERVDWFIHNACPDHHVRGGPAHARARHTAMRLLTRYPELARASVYTAIVCGDVAEVERVLAQRPDAANEKGGPKGWEPLLYLCFTRLALAASNDHAMAIARALLDRGADPRVCFMAGDSQYTPLVGVIGEGEEDRPAHPNRDALARLLLERGAEPFDIQVVYNISFHGKVLWFLELIHDQSVNAGRKSAWDDPTWAMLDMGGYGNGARWHLGMAVANTDLELAEWVLAHGASPEPPPPTSPKMFTTRTLLEDARRSGSREMADLLVRYGAKPGAVAPDDRELFAAACFRLDRDGARVLAGKHPDYLRSTDMIFAAARRDRADVVAFLLDLGVSPDVEDDRKQRALHIAAYGNALRVAALLLARGAAPDPVESNWSNTPLGAAVYAQHAKMIELLGGVSRDIRELVYVGNVARVREVLAREPELARVTGGGETPLMRLPDDDSAAMALVELLLTNGADPALRNRDGKTAADIAERRALFDVAGVLRVRAGAATSDAPAAPPDAFRVDVKHNRMELRRPLSARDEDTMIAMMRELRIQALRANGQMTDALVERVARLDHVTHLELQGSTRLTDEGVRDLAHLPRLDYLDLSGSGVTDRGLEVLRLLPELRTFRLCHHGGVSDAGAAHLADCHHLERVELMGTRTGDGAIRALTGKPQLRDLHAGNLATDAGLALLHEFPVFKTWHGGDIKMSLMEFAAEPNYLFLSLKAPFTNMGLANLVGLDGLFALNLFTTAGTGPFDDSESEVSAEGVRHLAGLPNLGWLGCGAGLGSNDTLRAVSAFPGLRFLSCQDAVAGDEGFVALSASRSLEYIWGRRCHNLRGRGFAALAAMPALRGLSVSCKNVDDAGLSALPRFPALREYMPMDVRDDGFRHVGRCEQLDQLWCMHCATTGDTATGHIAGLSHLTGYYAGGTRITDRSLEILGRMSSLERLTFSNCRGITDAGIAHLAALPRLRELSIEDSPGVSRDATSAFPAHVQMEYGN